MDLGFAGLIDKIEERFGMKVGNLQSSVLLKPFLFFSS